MVIMNKQLVGSIDPIYDIAKLNLQNGLNLEIQTCSGEELSHILEEEKADSSSDSNKFGEEFSDILLNSNFQLTDPSNVIPSMSVEVVEEIDSTNSKIELGKNVLDSLAILIQTPGYIVFTHNSKKIVNNSSYAETAYFKDTEPVFLNKHIARPLRELRVENNRVLIDYEVDDVPYYFEVLNVSSEGIHLSDFVISLCIEEFEMIKDKIDISELKDSNDRVEFKLVGTSLGKLNYSYEDYFIPVTSALYNRRRVLQGIKESFNLFENSKQVDKFLDSFNVTPRLGIEHESEGVTWKMLGSYCSIYSFSALEKDKERVREFIAMLERQPYDEFFTLSEEDNSNDKLLSQRAYKVFANGSMREELLDKIEIEIRLIDLLIMRSITEKLKLSSDKESIWIPTVYGQEIIMLEEYGEEESDE